MAVPLHSVTFREVQKFRQWWVWLLIYGGAALPWYGFVQQIIFGRPWGTNPAPDWMMWLIWLLIGIGMPIFFHSLRLFVEVRDDHIFVRYVPFTSRKFPFAEINSYEVRTYQPIKEYGGWGIKGWSDKRISYSVSGNRGVELEFYDGQKIMIGSQRADELGRAIAQFL